MDNPTYCERCDNVDPQSRKKAPYYWLCLQARRLEGMGFVVPGQWVNSEPYLRCKDLNGGSCKLFTPIRSTEAEETDSIPY